VATNAYLQSILLGSPDWTPLADEPVVVDATIVASRNNDHDFEMRYRGGTPAHWHPGSAVSLESVDLSEFEVKGDLQHRVLVAAYSPGDCPQGRSGFLNRSLSYASEWELPIGGGDI